MSDGYLVVDGPMNGRTIAVENEWDGFVAAVPEPRAFWAGELTGPHAFAPMKTVRYRTYTLAIPDPDHLIASLQTVVINHMHIVPEGTKFIKVWATKEPEAHVYTDEALTHLKGRLR